MPRAAPGVSARGALRRKLHESLGVPVRYSNGYRVDCLYRLTMEKLFHLRGRRTMSWFYFTLLFSGIGVDGGRLGEVVSLVGDCRPPPPGNPRRPINADINSPPDGPQQVSWSDLHTGSNCFTRKCTKAGEIAMPTNKARTFNRHSNRSNLKELNNLQYFKITRSYFSCIGDMPVLECCGLSLPPMRVNWSETPIYSNYICSNYSEQNL